MVCDGSLKALYWKTIECVPQFEESVMEPERLQCKAENHVQGEACNCFPETEVFFPSLSPFYTVQVTSLLWVDLLVFSKSAQSYAEIC